jgi:hypothetical protein
VPDCRVPTQRVKLAPLQGKPGRERYTGPVRPIPNRP